MRKTIAILFGVALAMAAQDPQSAAQADAQRAREMKIMAQTLQEQAKNLAEAKTFTFVGGQMYNGNPVKGAPYSAEAVTENTQTLADGNRIVNRSSTMQYRDSEGRERREESIGKLGDWNAQGDATQVVFISDPVAKFSYTLHPGDRTAERNPGGVHIMVRDGTLAVGSGVEVGTMVVRSGRGGGSGTGAGNGVETSSSYAYSSSSGGPEAMRVEQGVKIARAGAKNNLKTENLGTQLFDGVAAEGTRTTITIPAGQIGNERDINIVSERWYSKDLQMVVMTRHSDPRTGESVYRLTNINRAEPVPSLFEVPSDYKVTDGGAMMRKVIKQE